MFAGSYQCLQAATSVILQLRQQTALVHAPFDAQPAHLRRVKLENSYVEEQIQQVLEAAKKCTAIQVYVGEHSLVELGGRKEQ